MTRYPTLCLILCLALAACNHGEPDVVGPTWGLATPAKIATFERVELADKPDAHGITAGYSSPAAEPIIATIRLHAISKGNTLLPDFNLRGGDINAGASAQAMDDSIAQIHRYYPKAAVLARSPAFLLQKGTLQPGETATVTYDELHGGAQRSMQLKIYTFCCGDGHWSYEYRFRYPAGAEDEAGIAEFMRQSSWVSPP